MKKVITGHLLILFCLGFMSSCTKENECDEGETLKQEILTDVLESIHEDTYVPGFAVTIVEDEKIVYQKSFGRAKVHEGIEYTNETVQPIGSISKTFIAAALVKAIEQGYFTLNTDINDILDVDIVNPHHPDAIITIKHLVSHTSGLLDNEEAYMSAYHILDGENIGTEGAQVLMDEAGFQQRAAVPLEEFLGEYYHVNGSKYSTQNFSSLPPGQAWSYSNIASSLAAFLVEKATQTPFDEYVSSNILAPLGMHNSGYSYSDFNDSQTANLYWDLFTPFPKYGNDSYPDGSLLTSNEDLGRFLLEMTKGLSGHSSTLLAPGSYDLLFDPLLPYDMLPQSFASNQSMFWFHKNGNISHDGSDPGTTCNMKMDASGKDGFLLLTNMDASTEENEEMYKDFAEEVELSIHVFLGN